MGCYKLQSYFSNSIYNKDTQTVRIYKWNRNSLPTNRPNHSKIDADFMLTFDRIDNAEDLTGEKVCFFIKKDSDKRYVPVSIFPTDISFSDDGKINVRQCEFTLVREISPVENNIIFSASQERMDEIHDRINQDWLESEMSELKRKRKSFVSKPKPEVAKKYKRKLSDVLDKIKDNRFKAHIVIKLIQSLIDQKNDPNNERYKPYIEEELPLFKKAAEERGIDTSIFKAQINSNGTVSLKSSRVSAISNLINNIKKTVNTFLSNIIKPPEKNNRKNSVHSSKGNSKTKSQSKRSGAKKPVAGKPQNRNRTAAERSCEKPEQVSRTGSIFGPEQITKNAAKISEKHDKSRSTDKSKGRNNPDR